MCVCEIRSSCSFSASFFSDAVEEERPLKQLYDVLRLL